MGRLPDDGDLCSQPTISRLENLPDARTLLRMGRAMIDHCRHSFRHHVPRRIVLDIDDTFDAVHNGRQCGRAGRFQQQAGQGGDRRVVLGWRHLPQVVAVQRHRHLAQYSRRFLLCGLHRCSPERQSSRPGNLS